jgi:hypothetical protein
MALHRQRRFVVAGTSALAFGMTAVAVMPHPGPATSAARTASAACPDAGYSRDQLMTVVHAYRHNLAEGRQTLIAIDQGNYLASYDRCEERGGD